MNTLVPSIDFYDVDIDSDIEPLNEVGEPCAAVDCLVVGTNDGALMVRNLQHYYGLETKYNDMRVQFLAVDYMENAHPYAESVLAGAPKQVMILTSGWAQEAGLSELENDKVINGPAAAFYEVAKHQKIPCKVHIAHHPKHHFNLQGSRLRLPMDSYRLFSTLSLPPFDHKAPAESSIYM